MRCCAIGFFAVSTALGGLAYGQSTAQQVRQLQASIDPPVRVTPKRIAAIDAEGKIIGDWAEYVDRPRPAGVCAMELAYDTFWPDPLTGSPVGGDLCAASFSPYTRWFFGCDHDSPVYIDDAEFIETIKPVDRHQLAWVWYLTDTCLIRVSVYDMAEEGIQCERVPAGAFRGGFLLDFDRLARTCSYFYTDVDLCDIGATFSAPTGPALIKTEFLQSYDPPTGSVVYSPGPVSMMLWGIEKSLGRGVGENVGWVLTDEVMPNGKIDFPDECQDWDSFDLCPDPLAPMHAFYSVNISGPGSQKEECSIELQVFHMRVGEQPSFRIAYASPGRVVTIRYSKQPFGTGSREYVQFGEFCGESALRPLSGLGEVCRVTADASGTATCRLEQTIPDGYEGVTFNFQAFVEGHCPQPCDSLMVQQTIVE